MFWIVLGAVGVPVAVVGVFEESELVPSFEGLVDFVLELFYCIKECKLNGLPVVLIFGTLLRDGSILAGAVVRKAKRDSYCGCELFNSRMMILSKFFDGSFNSRVIYLVLCISWKFQ